MKAIDLTGQRFGKLVVERRIENAAGGQAQWECACDCGGKTIANTSILNSGKKVSCGCVVMHDLAGQRFGMLLVVKRSDNIGVKVSWLCQCDCGKTSQSTTANLLNGKSMSCGCVRTKHMGKGTLLYRTWASIKTRCTNPQTPCWHRYGGRGISVCNEWMNDFAAFRTWAQASGYKPGLSIDRIDNDGNYCPENCQWLTVSENSKKARKKC